MRPEYMKIVFLARRFYPDSGGVEKHVHEISKILIKEGHEITVITETFGRENQIDGIKIIRIPKSSDNWFKKFHIWKWMVVNRSLFGNADIVHAHDVFFWYLPLKLLFLSKKCFITFHGYENYPISKKSIIVRKLSAKLASGNIAVGDFIKKWYGTKSDYITYGGVRISKNIKKTIYPKSAVFIGRLHIHNGISEYVKAFEIVKKTYPDFKFAIVGDGPLKNKLLKYNLLGFKTNPSIYLEKYNIAFVSSYLSILEAIASKRLVFAIYDNPLKEDYLKMTPFSKFIVISNSPEDLSEKIKYYLKNPKIADSMTKDAFDLVKIQSWGNVVNIYKKLWKIN